MGGLTLLAQVASQADKTSIFAPSSPPAESIRQLAILVFVVSLFIFLIVEGVLFYALWRFRRKKDDTAAEPPQVYGSQPIEIAWTAAPALVVFVLVLVTTRTLWEVETNAPEPKANDQTTFVTVIGHQWWWEYVYENYDGQPLGFITANELHIPASDALSPGGVRLAGSTGASRPVYFKLESADVVHSFWIPRLAGKTDLIPGITNQTWFETAESGLFLGQCAEYCGAEHAGMLLRVVVESPEDFAAWLENQARPAVNDEAVAEGRELFLSQSCVNCHRIRGTTAAGTYAPDLTHLMSRETLASGLAANNRENLRKWIANPHDLKPGCLMPAFGLTDRELDLVVDYLLTLK